MSDVSKEGTVTLEQKESGGDTSGTKKQKKQVTEIAEKTMIWTSIRYT